MKKILVRVVIVLVALLAILFLARNLIARKSVEVGVKAATGFPLEINSVRISPGFNRLHVQGLHLMNPEDFPEPTFIRVPEFTVDYRLGSMIAMTPHIHELVMSLEQLNIVKNADGVSNIEKLKGISEDRAADDGEKPEEAPGEETPSGPLQYQVDVLRLHIGTVTVKDFSKQPPTTKNYPLNIDARYENINDPSDITKLVLITVMSKVGLANLGIDLGGLSQGLGNVGGLAGDVLKGGTETIGKTGKGLFDSLKKTIPAKE